MCDFGSMNIKLLFVVTRQDHIALAESQPTIPFRQMYKPLGQEEMGYIRKRLEEYTDRVRRQTNILDNFDNTVILADARTLFSYIALLESTIKTQRTEAPSKKRTMRSAGTAGHETCGKQQRRF
ncbi:hypothetical protein BDBG_01453 [Blastomyces gilchristii SLH14081]|uniref:Uncharacterized protein n=1 Tax=Blastomyces gilchristii (strain SLH14081) TaxID=559298 RepID=A0A179UEQ2_BLAGS|nr:uncharacterized protein BDBG_01453 [Blastomyces gilchristii SLH14081]OAT04992.1 hypothetical protein BDBG_01453 [Blastomyces gilchristii SLH14081]